MNPLPQIRMLCARLLLAAALLLGCGCAEPPVGRRLLHAASIVEAHPDSVRAMLDTTDPSGLRGKWKAYYGLLDARTRHKLYMPAPASDSLLLHASSYFGKHGPDSLLMQTLFYRGVRGEEKEEIDEAARSSVAAWEMASELGDEYWKGKAAEQTADLAQGMCNFQEELKWRRRAAGSYKKAGKDINSLYVLTDLGGIYLNLRDSLNVVHIMDSVGRVLKSYPDNEALQQYYAYNMIFIENVYGTPKRIDSLYAAVKDTPIGIGNHTMLSVVKANALFGKSKYAECRRYLDSISSQLPSLEERTQLYGLYYLLGKETGDFGLATASADTLLALQLKLFNEALSQPVTATQRDFFHELALQKEEQKHSEQKKRRLIAAGSVILLAGVLIFYRLLIRRKERVIGRQVSELFAASEEIREMAEQNRSMGEEIRAVTGEANALADRLAAATQDLHATHDRLHSREAELKRAARQLRELGAGMSRRADTLRLVYTGQWEIINRLCREMSGGGKFDAVKWANIRTELGKMKTEEFYRGIEEQVDLYSDGLASKLRAECGNLSGDEIKLAVLLMAGFSVWAIHFMIDAPQTTIYSRRKALVRKIEKMNPKDKEAYLDAILGNYKS